MYRKLTALMLALILGSWGIASAQDYDDDDIYFNPSKAKKETPKKKEKTQPANGMIYYYPSATDYSAADNYSPEGTGLAVSVDDYNRRGIFAADSSAHATDSLSANMFANTRRIEKFHNSSVVKGSGDESLIEYYYAQPANVSVIINAVDPWYSPYYAGYWGGYWGWRYPWSWGLGWGLSYAWGPSWSWGWTYPSYGWTWGPGWGWGASWGWGGGWAPTRPAWAHRPRPVGNVRPGYRPGATAGYRPSAAGSYRPGSSASGYRRGNVRGSSTGNYSRPSTTNNRNNSSNSYRPGRSTSGSSWGSSSSGGFRGGGGGYSRGSGGGGRGRH